MTNAFKGMKSNAQCIRSETSENQEFQFGPFTYDEDMAFNRQQCEGLILNCETLNDNTVLFVLIK